MNFPETKYPKIIQKATKLQSFRGKNCNNLVKTQKNTGTLKGSLVVPQGETLKLLCRILQQCFHILKNGSSYIIFWKQGTLNYPFFSKTICIN